MGSDNYTVGWVNYEFAGRAGRVVRVYESHPLNGKAEYCLPLFEVRLGPDQDRAIQYLNQVLLNHNAVIAQKEKEARDGK